MPYKNFDEVLKDKEISNIRELIELTDEELENILKTMKVENNKYSMLEYLGDLKGDDRTKKIIQTFAEKYCRCIDKVKTTSNSYAICTASIFNSKNIKGVGNNFQCDPPILYPINDTKIILRRK